MDRFGHNHKTTEQHLPPFKFSVITFYARIRINEAISLVLVRAVLVYIDHG